MCTKDIWGIGACDGSKGRLVGQCHGALRRRPAGTYLTSYVRRSKARITESNSHPHWCVAVRLADVAATDYASLVTTAMPLDVSKDRWVTSEG